MQKQLEFYFSPANLSTDEFMSSQIHQNNGFFPIELLLKFNKLKQLNASLESIKQTIKDSPLLEIDATETGVKSCAATEFNPDLSVLVTHIPKSHDLIEIVRNEFDVFGTIDLVKQTDSCSARVFYSTREAFESCLQNYNGEMTVRSFPVRKGFYFKAAPLTLKVDITSTLDCIAVDFTPESESGFALLRNTDARDVKETEYYFDLVVATKEQEEEMKEKFARMNKRVKLDDARKAGDSSKRGRGGLKKGRDGGSRGRGSRGRGK